MSRLIPLREKKENNDNEINIELKMNMKMKTRNHPPAGRCVEFVASTLPFHHK